jgi:hypothetical protein
LLLKALYGMCPQLTEENYVSSTNFKFTSEVKSLSELSSSRIYRSDAFVLAHRELTEPVLLFNSSVHCCFILNVKGTS